MPNGSPSGLRGVAVAGMVLLVFALAAAAGGQLLRVLTQDDTGGVDFAPMLVWLLAGVLGLCGLAFLAVTSVIVVRQRRRG